MPKRALVKGNFLKRRALLLPKEARYDELLKRANLGTAIVKAMDAIKRDFEPLQGQLPKERRDQVLMLDARNIFRKVTRKIYDFSPRATRQPDRDRLALSRRVGSFSGARAKLLESHAQRSGVDRQSRGDTANCLPSRRRCSRTVSQDQCRPHAPREENRHAERGEHTPLRELVEERDATAKTCFKSLDQWSSRIGKDWKKPCAHKLAPQKNRLAQLDPLAQACRELVKDVDLVCKLSGRVIDTAKKYVATREHDKWDGRAIGWRKRLTRSGRSWSSNSNAPPTSSARPIGCYRDFPLKLRSLRRPLPSGHDDGDRSGRLEPDTRSLRRRRAGGSRRGF